jgi:hypothetical protein
MTPQELAIDGVDALILLSFWETLTHLNQSLPEDLQHRINQVGQSLENGHKEAIADLENIAKHELLHSLYEEKARALQMQEEYNGFPPGPAESNVPYIGNITPYDTISTLTAKDSVKAAKLLKEKDKNKDGKQLPPSE